MFAFLLPSAAVRNFVHQGGGGNVPALRHDKPHAVLIAGLGWLWLGVRLASPCSLVTSMRPSA